MSQPVVTHSSPRRAPLGKSFHLCAGLLGAFLILQLVVMGIHFLPGLQQGLVRMLTGSTPEAPPPGEVSVRSEANQEPAPAAAQPPVDAALVDRVKELVAESDKAFRIGDFDLGLSKIREAEALVPVDAGILLRIARLQEKAGDLAEALATYKRVMELPDLSESLREQTMRKLSTIRVPEAPAAPTVEAAAEGADMRDEFGLQPGSSLGIVDTRLSDAANGAKELRIAIKGRPNTAIDPRRMAVHVFFYDRDAGGNVLLTESQIQTEWISPPVNWVDQEPELLNAVYAPPGGAALEYAGYVVGIYYNNELQDTRADPGSLAREHPLPLYLQSKPQ